MFSPAIAFPLPAWLPPLLGWFAQGLVRDTADTSADDADLAAMERLAAGDTLALRPLFDRWKLPLLNFFYRSLGSHADAEDLALQTFEKVYRAAPRYQPGARFSSWLFAIARNELRHELRRRRRKPVEAVDPGDLDWSGPAATIDPRQRTAELEEDLLLALRELPERERSALLLSSAEDLAPAEIARTLGVSTSNLYVILHRARQKLRDAFNQLHRHGNASA